MSKVTINPVESNEFKPFVLNITVESEEELAMLCAVFNTAISDIKRQALNIENNEQVNCHNLVEKYTNLNGHGLIYNIYCKLMNKFRADKF